MFGRIGVISAMARKRRQDKYRIGKTNDIELSEKDYNNVESVVQQYERSKNILTFYNVPFFIWSMGTVIILIGLYLLYNLLWGFEGKVFKSQSPTWWQYFIAAIIISLGLGFIFAVKREKVVFNRKKNSITISLRNILCQKITIEQKLNELINVRIVKRGMDSIQTQTIHYKIILMFQDGQYNEILETKSQYKIQGQYVLIMNFIEKEIGHIEIVDQTTQ